MTAPEFLLMAAAVFPILGALGSLVGTVFQFPNWGSAAARLGLMGGIVCSAVLTFLLFSLEFNTLSSSVHISVWTWFSMAWPRPTSLVFDLEANWIKACLASLVGGVLLAHEFYSEAKMERTFSGNTRLVDSLLCLALTGFLYASNLTQSLMGWLAISLLVGILIRLTRESTGPIQTGSVRSSAQSSVVGMLDADRRIQRLAFSLTYVEHFFRDRVWCGVVRRFPDWLGEQVEVVEASTTSFQVLGTILGSVAVLLTWLIVG